jgi:hypothetical protein
MLYSPSIMIPAERVQENQRTLIAECNPGRLGAAQEASIDG